MKERLQKYVSACGLMSRRAAEKAIEAGDFTVNGEKATIGISLDPDTDTVCYRGKPIRPVRKKIVVMLNKPAGYITTASDDRGRQNVCELVDAGTRLYPVGRLDKDSEGLLFLTNDGDFAARMMHPKYHLQKKYLVIVAGSVDGSKVDALRAMRKLDDEEIRPVDVRILSRAPTGSRLLFTLSEGKNRQIRRMCEQAGISVMQLRRLSVGNVTLDDLATGCWRKLTADEIDELMKEH